MAIRSRKRALMTLGVVAAFFCFVNLILRPTYLHEGYGRAFSAIKGLNSSDQKQQQQNCSAIPEVDFLKKLGDIPPTDHNDFANSKKKTSSKTEKTEKTEKTKKTKEKESLSELVRGKLASLDRTKPLVTLQDIPKAAFETKSRCYKYFQEVKLVRKTHVDVMHYSLEDADTTKCVCLITHLSGARFQKFMELADRWPGPISVSFYAANESYDSLISNITAWLQSKDRRNIAVHVTISEGKYYPVNYLRNVAMKHTTCTYMFLTDVDYMPNIALHSNLKNYILQEDLSHQNKVLVIAAFEMLSYQAQVPSTKTELLKQWEKKELRPFHLRRSTKNGHGATNYTRWTTANRSYNISFREGFEPYVLISKHVAPYFLELFLHRYGNKVSYFVELNARGFEFEVMPHDFVVHTMHPSLDSKQIFNEVGPCTSAVFSKLKSKIKSLASKV